MADEKKLTAQDLISGMEGMSEREVIEKCEDFLKDVESVVMDEDGKEDVLLLSYGPTSGWFTFDVMIATEEGIYDTIFSAGHGYVDFSSKDGRIVVTHVDNDAVKHIYDIAIEDGNNEKLVRLYENGEPLDIWGPPNTRNYTVLPETTD